MSHHQIEISSIQQLWSSAKEQLNKLRESLYVSEQKNRELNETIHQEKTNYKEQEIKNEMVRQSQQTKFEEERREYETQLFNEQTKATHLQYEIDTLRSELQDKNITIDEYNTQKEISNSEYNKLENTMTTLQLESTVNNQSQVMQFDLEERLNQSLHHLQTQQTQLLESRAAHSDVLTKMSNFENEVILLRSREKEIMNQRDRALEDCQHQELRAKIAEEETDKVIAWTSRAETTADAFSVMQASNTTRSLQLKSIPTVPANQSKSNYEDDSNNNDNSKTTTDDNLVIPPINTDVAEYAKIRRKAWINWLQENNLSEIGNDPNRHTRATLFRFRQSDKQEINFQKERYRIIRKKKYNTPEVTLKSHRVQRELKVQETIQNKLSWNHATSEFQMTDINGKKRYADLYNSETGILIEVEDFDTWPNAIGQLRRYQTILEREGKSVNKMILVVFNCGDQDTKDMKQVCKKFDIVARCWWSFLAQASFITMSNFLCVKLDRNTRSSNSKRDTDYSIPPLPDTKSLSHNEKDT